MRPMEHAVTHASTRVTVKRVQVWIPDLGSAVGGIQMFSHFFIRAVAECFPRAEICVLSKNDVRVPALPAHNPELKFVHAGRWPKCLRTPAFFAQLAQAVLWRRPDVVLSTHVNFAPFASWLRRLHPFPWGVVAHGIDVWGEGCRRLGRALNQAERIMCVSRFTRDRAQEVQGLQPARMGVLPNTLDEDRFQPGEKPTYLLDRFGLTRDQPVILTIARLAGVKRYKGYDQIIRALPAIKAVHPTVRYIVGGAGPDRSRIEALVKELGLEHTVILAGYVPDAELPSYYQLCDVFAMPSKGEGFGIVYLEAMACGKPVLAGNKDGSVDALRDGELGVLVDPDDVTQMGDALAAMLSGSHPFLRNFSASDLSQKVRKVFGREAFTRALAAHLEAMGLEVEINRLCERRTDELPENSPGVVVPHGS